MSRSIRYIALLGLLLLHCFSVFGQLISASIGSSEPTNSVVFIENRGQVHNQLNQPRPDVLCIGVSKSSQLLITETAYSHQLNRVHYREPKRDRDKSDVEMQLVDSTTFSRVDLHWLNSSTEVGFEKISPRTKQYNFYNLPHNSVGITGVREFESVRLNGIYPGIDVRFYDADGLFEHDYEIAPGADYQNIRIKIEGAVAQLSKSGELVLETSLGTVTESSPVVFQNGKELESTWIQLEHGVWGFNIPAADNNLAMVIDPISRVWGTYYGGNELDEINHIHTDDEGFIYAVGETSSSNNIATSGAFQEVVSTGKDAKISKFDEDGNQIWGTYLGGNGNESAWSCDIKGDGILYVIGRTESTDNIATAGAHQETHGDGGIIFDGFIQRFTSDGIRVWGTYYGGEDYDRCRHCHIAPDGNLYVAGVTKSFVNISTTGSHQEQYMGSGDPFEDDAMLIKFDPDGNRIWATYYGGALWEEGFACVTDEDENVYLFGHAESSTNISTPGSYQPNHAGGTWDSFIAKFNSAGERQWGTYLGGSGQDLLWSGNIDSYGNIYCAGRTQSADGIATAGAHQENNGGDFDAYLMKFSSDGDRIWGTYFGGNQFERAYGCNVTDDDFILVSGHTESANSISTTQVHQENFGGNTDAFLSKFKLDGALQWSTYYGGTGVDVGRSCTSYSGNAIYLAGFTQSSSAISTPGIHQEVYAGSRDGFVVKFGECQNFYNTTDVEACVSYTAPNGDVLTESGEYIVIIDGPLSCDSTFTINLTITDQLVTNQYHTICEGNSITLPDGTTTSEEGTITNEYISVQGCDSLVNHHISIAPNYEVIIDTTICDGEEYLLPDGTFISASGSYYSVFFTIIGCDSIVNTNLQVLPTPEVSLDVPGIFCLEEEFIPLSPTPAGGTLSGVHIADNGLNLENAVAGNYSVTYEFTDINGCSTQVVKPYSILSAIQPSFSYAADCLYHVEFLNQTNSHGEDLSFEWVLDSTGFSTEISPGYTFSQEGQYTIELIATNAAGCQYSYFETITLANGFSLEEFWIPNVITPNGDGKNDVLKSMPENQNCLEYEIMIFNRWGMKVFQGSSSGSPFDGRDPDGQMLPDGTYFYILETNQIDCSDNQFDNICRGTVTILR